MKTQKQPGAKPALVEPALVDQPGPLRKRNAWWRRIKIGRAQRHLPHVISEGVEWFGRKTPDQRAFVWIRADEFVGKVAANDGSRNFGK